MKKAMMLSVCCLAVMLLSGCSKSADSLVKDQIAAMNDMADALENDKSEADIKKIEKRMEKIGKDMEELKLSDEEKKKLYEKHKEEIDKVMGRLLSAAFKKGFKNMPKMDFGK